MYTNDFKTEQGVSFAAYNENFRASKKVSNCISIFTAEFYGTLKAINYSVNVVEESILLATDSKNS